MTLLVAAAISVLLWFIPYAEILTYPFRIFVTFIHEGGHALAALLTGHSVESLSVAKNASGVTQTSGERSLFSSDLYFSAGYLGAMAFGALLLMLIRRTVAARIVLLEFRRSHFWTTIIFGLIKPVFSFDFVVRNSVHVVGWNVYFAGAGLDSAVRERARRDVLRQFSCRAVRAQRALRSEDSLLPLVTLRALRAHRCSEHGQGHRHSSDFCGP